MTTTAPTETRVVGRRRSAAKRETFQLAVYRGEKEELWDFTVRGQMDTASVFALSADDVSSGRRLMGLQNFLMRALVDDDGISIDSVPVQVVQAQTAEDSTSGSDTGKGELVPVDDVDSPDLATSQWRIGEGAHQALFPSESLARQHANENGSSLRRFVYVMDSPRLLVEQTALEEIVDIVVSAAADRPTEASSNSSRSARRKPR